MTDENERTDIFKTFIDGQDVPTVVGLGQFGPPEQSIIMANIVVDYSTAEQSLADFFVDEFPRMWDKDILKDGFLLNRTGPETVRVESKCRWIGMAFGGGHEEHANLPYYFIDAQGDKSFVDDFTSCLEAKQIWVFHALTKKESFIYVVHHPSGRIITKFRREKIDLKFLDKRPGE